jgi:hypothetical protein
LILIVGGGAALVHSACGLPLKTSKKLEQIRRIVVVAAKGAPRRILCCRRDIKEEYSADGVWQHLLFLLGNQITANFASCKLLSLSLFCAPPNCHR